MWHEFKKSRDGRGQRVSAGRLLRILLALQDGQRHTAAELADRLEVAVRTIMRDIEVLVTSGVDIHATRGPHGGFRLANTDRPHDHPVAAGSSDARGPLRRVRVRVAPHTLRRALASGAPEGWRPRPHPDAAPRDRPDWIEGTFRFSSYDTAVGELLALAPDIEVVLPAELRQEIATVCQELASRHHA
jgi:predicted DNA-binding transcriptional regulator YafY